MATSFPGIGGEDFDSRNGGWVCPGGMAGQPLAIGGARLVLGTAGRFGVGPLSACVICGKKVGKWLRTLTGGVPKKQQRGMVGQYSLQQGYMSVTQYKKCHTFYYMLYKIIYIYIYIYIYIHTCIYIIIIIIIIKILQ